MISAVSEKVTAEKLLQDICAKLEQDFGLKACIGAEIEFYLLNDDISGAPFVFKKERGLHQYEIDLPPLQNPSLVADKIENAKEALIKWRPAINFHPKPFLEDYGSAMHFHINLLEGSSNYYDDVENLNNGAKALCHYLKQTFLVFAPNASHYTRFDGKMMAPSKVAYGGNNRSVAIRIPDARPYRLEHRVSSPETDPYLALFAIIKSLYLGLKYPDKIGDYEKIYGNAYDAQYNLENLPQNLDEAIAVFDNSFFS